MAEYEHPAFTLAKELPEPWRSHFPKTREEAGRWQPNIFIRALASRVLVVAKTRVECAWAAYIDAVPGHDHDREHDAVLDHGDKLQEDVARVLFPALKDVPYSP